MNNSTFPGNGVKFFFMLKHIAVTLSPIPCVSLTFTSQATLRKLTSYTIPGNVTRAHAELLTSQLACNFWNTSFTVNTVYSKHSFIIVKSIKNTRNVYISFSIPNNIVWYSRTINTIYKMPLKFYHFSLNIWVVTFPNKCTLMLNIINWNIGTHQVSISAADLR